MDITFKVNGRRVPANQIGKAMGNALERAAFQQTRENVKARLSGIRCSVHHQAPQVTSSGSSLSNLTWDIQGCCALLKHEAQRALQ
jgi:hypothetical protein